MASMKIYRLATKWMVVFGTVLIVPLVDGNSNSSRVAVLSPNSWPTHDIGTSIFCSSTFSCNGRCSNKTQWDNAVRKPLPPCHCDPDCTKYQDCCADYRKFCGNQTLPSSSDPVFVCRHLNDAEPSIWLIESCPSSYKYSEIRNRCLANQTLSVDRITETIPVVDINGKLQYKNKHCGICNGVNPFFLFPFKIRIRCSISPPKDLNSLQTLDYMLKLCPIVNMELKKPTKRRFCYPIVNTCPVGASKEEKDGCERGPTAVVYSRITKRNYRNAYCMVCHGLNPQYADCGPQKTDNVFQPKSFEVVVNFNMVAAEKFVTIKEETIVKCPKGHAYDKHLEICRRAIQSAPTKATSDKYRVNMWLSPLDGQQPRNLSHEDFVNVLTTQFVDLLPNQIELLSIKVEDRIVIVQFDLHARYIWNKNQKNSSLNGMQLNALLNFKDTFEMKIAQRPWLVVKVTTRRLSCTQVETYPPGHYRFFPHNESILINSTVQLECFLPKQYYMVGKNESRNVTDYTVVVCRSFFGVHCDQVHLAVKENEYVMFKNKSLLFKPTGQQYAEGEYDLRNNTPWICTDYTVIFSSNSSNNTGFNKTTKIFVKKGLLPVNIHTNIRQYMTTVGLTISVLCLLLVLLVHGILRELRDPLPGKNLISLSISLFLTHFWYLMGSGETDKPLFCQITACILHYLFLASFGCTFIVAYDTRRTFSVKTAKAHAVGTAHQAKRLAVYILISWGIPFVLVVTCAILDWLDVVAIGYRNEDVCWMGNKTALLVVFAAPIGSVLVYNVLAFTQTIYAINSARKQTQRVKSSHYSRPATVKIYIRLVSLMGFSWFFGISAPLIHHGLMYPFVFFTTLQGLYIFLAFVCKARVLRMLKAKLPLNKRKHVRRPTKGTTTTTDSRTSTPYSKYPSPTDETKI